MKDEKLEISSYVKILEELKGKIRQAQYKAYLTVNKEMIFLYWDIGKTILEQQKKQGWGAKVIDRLSKDLTATFPAMKGLSPRNLKYMRQFALLYPNHVNCARGSCTINMVSHYNAYG